MRIAKRDVQLNTLKWLQAASMEVAGSHPGTPLEEDADRTNPIVISTRSKEQYRFNTAETGRTCYGQAHAV